MRKPKNVKAVHKDFEGKNSHGQFIKITFDMYDSVAWVATGPYAHEVYIALKRKYKGNNEDDISLTYEEGSKLMNERTFTKAIDSLIEHGFIKWKRQGRVWKAPNIYALTDLWQKWPNIITVPRKKQAQKVILP